MDCGRASELFSPYIDDMLDTAEARALRAHLDTCAACEAECARFLRMRETLLRTPAPPLPAAFDERLRQAVRLSREANARSRRLRLWSSVAAVFAIGLLSLFVHSRFDAARSDLTSAGGAADETAVFAPADALSEDAAQTREEASAAAVASERAEESFTEEGRVDYVADAGGDFDAGAPVYDTAGSVASADASAESAASVRIPPAYTAEQPGLYDGYERPIYPARGTTTGAHRLDEKAVCDELLRDKLAGWTYEILWEEKRDSTWIYRVNLIGNGSGTRFDQEVEIHVSGGKSLQVYYATEFMGF
ncbi:MAG: zf-HC2 domain-containing protein [Clostridiales Family XIII bacterium]|jgi:hypothetical protein|nr:zf-HC2 domain-containing protein [Clostridiales Family XIII bacterium]